MFTLGIFSLHLLPPNLHTRQVDHVQLIKKKRRLIRLKLKLLEEKSRKSIFFDKRGAIAAEPKKAKLIMFRKLRRIL
jgi:hypothetical protein